MSKKRAIIESPYEPSKDSLWLFKNTIKAFINGKWQVVGGAELTPEEIEELKSKVDAIDKEVGEVKQEVSVLNSKAIVELEIGNTPEIKNRNLAKLKAIQSVDHLFFADIDYGYGAAKWLPTTGGEAFIVTSSGRAVIYNIATDGSVTKASTDIDLTNPNTELFEVVTELPVENISTSKIYCVLSSKVGEENKYTEYAYIKQTDGQYAWEKMGEFKAEPDLSGYAKLNSATFGNLRADIFVARVIGKNQNNKFFETDNNKPTSVYTQDGLTAEIGPEESFVFTLEDGSKVTKSIRVVSTTNS